MDVDIKETGIVLMPPQSTANLAVLSMLSDLMKMVLRES